MQTVKKKSLLTVVPKKNHSNNAAKSGVTNPTNERNVAVYFVSR